MQKEGARNRRISRVLTDRNEDSRNRGSDSQTRCNRRDTYSEEVSIRNLEFIGSNNVGEYELEGRCEVNNALVYVTVNGYKIESNPKCDRGRWKVTIDLSSVASEVESIVFQLTHNEESLCKEVRVSFLGPGENEYIPISYREDYYESGFYVMKYEAKIDSRGPNAKAESKPEGRPLSRISYKEALQLCRNKGSRYDLMQNSQWQNIALSIEEVHENWSLGHVGPSDNNALNCGLFRGNPREASSNDEDDCAVTSCDSGWDQNRRTHILPGGERIWDMCGNVGEMMKDKYRGESFDGGYIYELSSHLKRLFGPRKTYNIVNASRRSNTWNLGYAKIEGGENLIVRGLPGREAGIFSVDVTNSQESRRGYAGDVGFRCVYNP